MKNYPFSAFALVLIFCAFAFPAKAQNFAQIEREVLDEINRLRRNPSAYAKWIEDNRNNLPYTPEPQRIKVIDEAIGDLRKTPSLPLLTASPLAYKAAKKQLEDYLPLGIYKHKSLDGSSVDDRLRRVGNLIGAYAENAVLMNPEDPLTAERIVLVWIIDDTVRGRGHRKVLLDKNYFVAGIACGKFPDSKIYKDYSLCVANFAQQLL